MIQDVLPPEIGQEEDGDSRPVPLGAQEQDGNCRPVLSRG